MANRTNRDIEEVTDDLPQINRDITTLSGVVSIVRRRLCPVDKESTELLFEKEGIKSIAPLIVFWGLISFHLNWQRQLCSNVLIGHRMKTDPPSGRTSWQSFFD